MTNRVSHNARIELRGFYSFNHHNGASLLAVGLKSLFFYSGHPLYYYKDLGGIIQDAMLHGGNIKLTGTFQPPLSGQLL